MSEYLLINIFTIAVPLALSFEKKIKFYKNFPALGLSILIVGGTYIIWDIIAANRGDWWFNPEYLLGLSIFNLPIEEILFFITVPYASIFIYETGMFYLTERELKFDKSKIAIPGLLAFIVGMAFLSQYYTVTVMIFTSLFFFTAFSLYPEMLTSKIYWLWIIFTFIPFLLVNYILTSLPIVFYNPEAIWGIRVITIPVEDFFYSFSMLSLYLLVYLIFKERWQQRRSG